MYGIFDGLLGTLPHAHDALDVVLLVLTAHSHPPQQLQQPAHLHWVTALTCNSLSSPSSPLTTTAATNQPPLGHCVRLQSSIISIITLLLPTSPATAAAMTHHCVHLQSSIIIIIIIIISLLLPTSPATAAATNPPPLGHCAHLQFSIITISLLLPTSPATTASTSPPLCSSAIQHRCHHQFTANRPDNSCSNRPTSTRSPCSPAIQHRRHHQFTANRPDNSCSNRPTSTRSLCSPAIQHRRHHQLATANIPSNSCINRPTSNGSLRSPSILHHHHQFITANIPNSNCINRPTAVFTCTPASSPPSVYCQHLHQAVELLPRPGRDAGLCPDQQPSVLDSMTKEYLDTEEAYLKCDHCVHQ